MHPTEKDKRAVLFLVEQGFATIERIVEQWKKAWLKSKTKAWEKHETNVE